MKKFIIILTAIALIAISGYRFSQPGGFFGYKYESIATLQVHPSSFILSPTRSDNAHHQVNPSAHFMS